MVESKFISQDSGFGFLSNISEKIIFVVLILSATGLFIFLAPMFGVSIGTISLLLLVFNCLYCLPYYAVNIRTRRA